MRPVDDVPHPVSFEATTNHHGEPRLSLCRASHGLCPAAPSIRHRATTAHSISLRPKCAPPPTRAPTWRGGENQRDDRLLSSAPMSTPTRCASVSDYAFASCAWSSCIMESVSADRTRSQRDPNASWLRRVGSQDTTGPHRPYRISKSHWIPQRPSMLAGAPRKIYERDSLRLSAPAHSRRPAHPHPKSTSRPVCTMWLGCAARRRSRQRDPQYRLLREVRS